MLGRAGAGKTHACLARLVACLDRGRRAGGTKPLLLVPTYSQAEHLRYALLDRTKGLSENTIETFSSLAERLTRIRLRELVAPPQRDALAEQVLREYFPAAAGQPGFRAEFLAAVKEIKEQGLAPASVAAHAQAHFGAGTRGRLLFDAYAAYDRALEGLDHEDLALRAREVLRADAPAHDLFLVDGFHDFTPVQRDMVDRLAERAGETVVTLPLDPDDRTNPVFATAARTAAQFADYAVTALRGNRRASPGLAAIEQRLFRRRGAPVAADALSVIAASSEEDEADRVARLVAASGRGFSDFLVVRRSFAGLHGLYRAAFRRHGVPLRFYAPEQFLASPAAGAAALWLRHVAEGPLPPGDLLPLLQSPYFLPAPPERDVDALAAWLRRDPRRDDGPKTFPRIDEALAFEPEDDLGRSLRRRFGVERALKHNPDGDVEIARAAQFFALLAREADAAQGLPLPEAAAKVARRLPLLRAALPDRRHDCVYAVEALDARQWEKPVVIVAGLTSTSFPRQVRQDVFLPDEDRRGLAEVRGLHLPLRSRKEDEERYLFYVALTRAREEVVLTYAAFDEMGTPRSPSPYLEETLAHFTGVPRRDVGLSEIFAPAGDVVHAAELLPLVADGLMHGDPVAAALYERNAVPRPELARPRRLALARTRRVADFPRDPAARLSPSAMKRFMRCPYLHMMRLLRVERPREHALDPLTRGSIVHDALERIGAEILRGEAPDVDAVFDAVFAESAEGMRLGLDQQSLERTMRVVVRDAAARMRACPVERVEYNFELDVGDVVLRGRIDRVDRYPGGRLVRDYKTGDVNPEKSEIDAIQLDAYMLATDDCAGAVFERLKTGDVAGYVTAALADEVEGKHVETISAESLAGRAARVGTVVGSLAARARAGRLAVAPEEPEKCTRTKCDGYDLCRVARGRWLARRAREERA